MTKHIIDAIREGDEEFVKRYDEVTAKWNAYCAERGLFDNMKITSEGYRYMIPVVQQVLADCLDGKVQ